LEEGNFEMSGTGFFTALDSLKPTFDLINAMSTQFLPLSIEQYGLHEKPVLDRIAALASTRNGNQVRAYDSRAAVQIPDIAPTSIDELFEHSQALKYTFNIEYIESHIPEASALAIDLAAFFGGSVAVHAFVSGAGVPSTPIHYDYTHAFTFQLTGSKRWQCHQYLEQPTFGAGGYVVNPDQVGPMTLDKVLHAGETLFVPRGKLHLVSALPNSNSVHLAVSVKHLGCYRFIAPFLDPDMDDPEWAGTRFEQHVEWMTNGINKFPERASSGQALEKARIAIWQMIYEQHHRMRCPPPAGSASEPSRVRWYRSNGRPVIVRRLSDCIAVEFLDPSGELVGNRAYGFGPSRVELPLEAEPFAKMLERGVLDEPQLRETYDSETAENLLQLVQDMEIFHHAADAQ
jgi:hypothetical protein